MDHRRLKISQIGVYCWYSTQFWKLPVFLVQTFWGFVLVLQLSTWEVATTSVEHWTKASTLWIHFVCLFVCFFNIISKILEFQEASPACHEIQGIPMGQAVSKVRKAADRCDLSNTKWTKSRVEALDGCICKWLMREPVAGGWKAQVRGIRCDWRWQVLGLNKNCKQASGWLTG